MRVEVFCEGARRVPDATGGITAVPGTCVLLHDVIVCLIFVAVNANDLDFFLSDFCDTFLADTFL